MDVKHSSGTRKRRAAAKNKNQIQFDRNQVIINNDILELERELEHGLETVSGNMLCDNEILIGHTGTLKSRVQRYTTYIRDILELADPKSLREGVMLHNILNDDMVESIFQETDGMNDTIYKNNVPRFLAFSRGFITHVLFDTKSNTVSMSIDIEIPLAYLKNTIPVYNVHQIGFIPKNGGPCLKFNLPKSLAYDNGMFYEINCQSDICIDTIASTSPSCLVNEPNNSCQTILSHCFMPQSSFSTNDGLLLTTNHGVYSIDGSGIRTKLPRTTGSIYVPWDALSRVEVESENGLIYKTFYPPNRNMVNSGDVFYTDSRFDEFEIGHEWLAIFKANHSIQNEITRKTAEDIKLINGNIMSRETQLSVWIAIGFVLATVVIALVIICCRKKKRTVYILENGKD